MFDVAIVGGGAAGLSAAINITARNKKPIVITGTGMESSALYKAEMINNYLGMPKISGRQLLEQFYNHASVSGAIIEKGRVLQIVKMDSHFSLQVERQFINAKSIILATGITKKANLKGESDFTGKGVSYCATCDGMLYRGRDAVVIAETPEGEEEANFLSEICRTVSYYPTYGEPQKLNSVVKILSENITEIAGSETVTHVKTKSETINCDGVFLIKNATPVTSLIYGLELENGAISVDSNMMTNISGVFACGDCTGAPYQVSKATGQGLVAGLEAVKFVSQ